QPGQPGRLPHHRSLQQWGWRALLIPDSVPNRLVLKGCVVVGKGKFSPEFKKQMVELFLEQQNQKTLAQVARENGVGGETLRNWVKKYRVENPDTEPPLTVSERARMAELERENRELKLEREFLGKAAAFFAKEYR
ncbi:MAG: transposase, partial [Actinomycetia bacterium]|nr:transposase [Actinomycetes bacterium]